MRIHNKVIAAVNGVAIAAALTAVSTTPADAAEPSTDSQDTQSKLTLKAADAVSAPQTADEAKANLEDKQSAAAQAKQETDSAQADVTVAQKTVDNLSAETATAKTALDNADSDAAKAFEKAKSDASSAVKDAESKVSDAQAQKDAATAAVEQATTDEQVAATVEENAKKAWDDAKASSPYKSEDIDQARKDVESARQTQSATQAKKDAADAAVTTRQSEYDAAVAAVGSAEKAVADAEASVSATQEKVERTKADLEQAQKAYDNSLSDSASEEATKAWDAVQQARQVYDEAAAAVEATRGDLAAAESELASYQASLDKANAELSSAKESRAQALAKLDEKQAAYDAAVAAYEQASSTLDAIEQELSRISADIEQKQAEKKTAQESLSNLNAQIPALEQTKQTAQAELDAATPSGQGITSAREFYEWLGDTAQATRFDWDTTPVSGGGATLTSFTNQGARGDATSVENIKKVFDYIRECNELRRKAGVAELLITDSLMYEAQVGVNWSDENWAHNNRYSSSENLAWVSGDPFKQWYDAEYKKYQEAVSEHPDIASMNSTQILMNYPSLWSKIGHYLNIVNPDYLYTGFAYTNQYANCITYCQTFYKNNYGYVSPTKASLQKTYTVDEYETLFLEALSGPKLTDEQRAVIAAKQSALNSADAALSAAVAKRNQASETVASASSQIEQLQASYATKQSERERAAATKQAAEEDRDQKDIEVLVAYVSAHSGLQANSYISDLQATVGLYEGLVSESGANVSRIEEILHQHEDTLNEKSCDLDSKEKKYSQLSSSSDILFSQLQSTRSEYEQASNLLAVAQQDVSDAQVQFAQKQQERDTAWVSLEQARKEASVVQQELASSTSVLQQAEARFNSISASYSSVQKKEEAYKQAHESHTSAVENLEKAKDREIAAETALVDAKLRLSDAQQIASAAQKLSYSGASSEPESDERFAYLNEKLSAVVAAQKAYDENVAALDDATNVLKEKKAALADAQEIYATTLADLAMAQQDYDAIVKTSISNASVSGIKAKTYSGKNLTQSIVVKVNGKSLQLGRDYTLSYKNNKNAGKNAQVIVKGIGQYTGTIQRTFTIKKAANKITVKAKATKSVKASTLKKKKLSLKSLVTVKKNQGKLVYSNASKTKVLKKFKINSKNGTITVAKKTKKGLYKLRVKIVAKGNANYAAKTKYITVRIRVK